MIDRVEIKNFKSIGALGVDLEVKPFTLLVGPNGAGKSTILEAIALSSQVNLDGALVQFPSWTSILHNEEPVKGAIVIGFRAGIDAVTSRYSFGFGPSGGPTIIYHADESKQSNIQKNPPQELREKTFLISSVRGDVPYELNASGSPGGVGAHGESLLSLLSLIFGDLRYEEQAKRLTKWADRFGITSLNAGFRGGGKVAAAYRDSKSKVRLELALSSSGARQIITVITQLFWTPNGSVVMIEEPEISLHPKAQIDVLEMFAEAIRKDHKQIIVTTHSLILPQALGYAVQKGWLNSSDIAVYHVEKGKEGTSTKALALAKHGYMKQWVPSYTKVERHLLREWAKSLPRD